ncbi:TonB-dependent receptor plug domain-containing protein [Zobellia galactanivorans]|uniref:TonB-dependent Receptor n=1 Tax=Zobellia galactanivorans (strain DSM 12802 / CCUG 47099 / CIP 106680 / NCIMB 13871 / Dsij) TaxID=63186 RepID=G0L884_ZOBGA|nr:TonB-dependent receptor plug domain-containing protein [Zobellia galactanivorans]CAZ98027.1 TonB-dependent Receptor [Zobellia galactanivorans]
MSLRVSLTVLSTLFCVTINAQEQRDSTGTTELEEVVVTGQYNRQSVDKSVFQVKVVPRRVIDNLAANNLADVLNQTLNINIVPNPSSGKSGVQLFGLDSQYFKILIDNVPLINDEGLGNNTDLTQLNLDDVEQVEIVEGSMGVQYGSNAVSGIINIITKKSSAYKWQINPYVQEETIGSEYGFANKGRHIQSLKVGHNISKKWYMNGTYTRNDFAGHFGDRKGQDYERNDGHRGHEWLPKLQNNAKALVRYNGDGLKAFYRFEYFDEEVALYDSLVRTNLNSATQTTNPTASDEIFLSKRFNHHFNLSGNLIETINYDASFSYQQQKRDIETYNYRIRANEKFDQESFEYESRKGFYSRGTLNNLFRNKWSNYQFGYEVNAIDGYSSSLAGDFETDHIKRRLESYDIFASAEYIVSKKFSVRPGVRSLFSSKFDPQTALSLSLRYFFENGYQLRAVLGTSPRSPNYDELFSYFVDINHDLRGNEDLDPERGYSAFLHLNKEFWAEDSAWSLKRKLSAWYLSVDDRIELTIVNTNPLAFQYNNIDGYKTWGLSYANTLSYNKLQLSGGISFSGQSKSLESQEDFNDDYLYSVQLNGNLSYRLPKWNTVFSAYYKFTGKQYQFLQDQNEEGEVIFIKGEQDQYGWLDATVKKSFYDNRLQLTLGARNLMDITRVNTVSAGGGTVHSNATSSVLLGYGRSYFLKLSYNLNL